jgi:hypothetical protein
MLKLCLSIKMSHIVGAGLDSTNGFDIFYEELDKLTITFILQHISHTVYLLLKRTENLPAGGCKTEKKTNQNNITLALKVIQSLENLHDALWCIQNRKGHSFSSVYYSTAFCENTSVF